MRKYLKILLECIKKIENCLDYIQIEDSWKCKNCQTGYKLSSLGLCDECQEGYLKIGKISQYVKSEIDRCIEYDINSEDSKCLVCEAGYKVDSDYKCNSCESGYVEVSYDPLECAWEILSCISYKLYEGDWVCNSCNQGYK
jgi:hypothetical protein